MARNIFFKTLVDILFLGQVVGFIGIIFYVPAGVVRINMMDSPVQEWSWTQWLSMLFSFINYVVFVMAFFHLRKVARRLISNNYFDVVVVSHLKKSGHYFVLTGIIGLLLFLAFWLIELSSNKLTLYQSDFMVALFVTTIGLFFIIQSDVIRNAKHFKDDSELTI